jgi:HPr kinase/phosphorylase
VLLLGPSGSGKSDLLLRLLDRGFALVADDRVDLSDGVASAPAGLAGLLEVRGLGVFRMPHVTSATVALAVELGAGGDRMPLPATHAPSGRPLVRIDPAAASAAQRVAWALDCALGRTQQLAGAFA